MSNLRTKINERAIDLEDYPETYLAKRKKEVETFKTYANAFKQVITLLKDMPWQDITFEDGPTSGGLRYQFPILPTAVRVAMSAAIAINPNKARADFKQGSLSFTRTFDNADPSTDSNIHMKVESESSGQRSHFPGNGIPAALKGTNLGYKLYRALLEKFKYLRSNTGGTTEKDYAWQSIISTKKDAEGNLTPDDVHSIIASGAVFAMIKSLPDAKKIKYATNFINSSEVNKSNITKKNFGIDAELKAILPDSVLAEIDPTRREEAERIRKERAEREERERNAEALRTNASRFELYAPHGIEAYNWEIGDYIVVKQYLMQTGYNELPVRKVVEKNGNEWVALAIADLAAYEATGALNNVRKTTRRNEWVKSQWKRGMYNYAVDPTAGRLAVKGGGTGAAPVGRTSAPAAQAPTENEQSSQQRKLVANFMRGEFSVFLKSEDWTNKNRFAGRHRPIVSYLVKKIGTGRSATYSVMNGRTAELQRNITQAEFNALNLKKFDIVQLERKSSVSEGDWVFAKDHRSAQGFASVVYRITPASNRQPGLYIWTGGDRPQYIAQPTMLYKLVEATNESMSTSLFRFEDML